MTDCYVCSRIVPPQPLSKARASHAAACAHARLKGGLLDAQHYGVPCESARDLGSAIPLAERLHEQQMIWLDDSRWDLDA